MALFACSFDAATPLAPWTTTSGVSIVPGRDANGCAVGTGQLLFNGALGASISVGMAVNTSGFSNSICGVFDTSAGTGVGIGAASARIDNNGDGRMGLFIAANQLGALASGPIDGFVQSLGIWNYYELVTSSVTTIVPVDPTHSNISVTVSASLYVNNSLIGSITDGWGATNIPNVDLPVGTFSNLTVSLNRCIIDDVYINATRIGDCFVAPDDTTITVETSAPGITQALVEIGLVDPTAAPDVTQTVIEIGIGPSIPPPVIACPSGSGMATAGVLFISNPPIVTGDTPPDSYTLVSGPAWMSINASTGIVSGIPTVNGPFTFIIEITDAALNTATTSGCNGSVSCPPQFFPGSGGNNKASSAGDKTGTIVLPPFQPGKGGNRFGNN